MTRQSSDIVEFKPRGNFGLWLGKFEDEFSPTEFIVDSHFAYSNKYGRCLAAHQKTISFYSFPKMEERLVGDQLNLFEDEEIEEDLMSNTLTFKTEIQLLRLSTNERFVAMILKDCNELVVFDIGTFSKKVG